jgi:hypothetical protein
MLTVELDLRGESQCVEHNYAACTPVLATRMCKQLSLCCIKQFGIAAACRWFQLCPWCCPACASRSMPCMPEVATAASPQQLQQSALLRPQSRCLHSCSVGSRVHSDCSVIAGLFSNCVFDSTARLSQRCALTSAATEDRSKAGLLAVRPG